MLTKIDFNEKLQSLQHILGPAQEKCNHWRLICGPHQLALPRLARGRCRPELLPSLGQAGLRDEQEVGLRDDGGMWVAVPLKYFVQPLCGVKHLVVDVRSEQAWLPAQQLKGVQRRQHRGQVLNVVHDPGWVGARKPGGHEQHARQVLPGQQLRQVLQLSGQKVGVQQHDAGPTLHQLHCRQPRRQLLLHPAHSLFRCLRVTQELVLET
mmetsp:Transcript_14483/g.25598  ORF Transcript_14483/g.25598 Transcript_14483/m.25598 type:complete len:209 (+) Transcript_14483:446-1072(+)